MLDDISFPEGDKQNFMMYFDRLGNGTIGVISAIVSDTNSIQNALMLLLPEKSGGGEIVYTF